MQLGIFPLNKFDTWESMPVKSYPILKMFIHEVYSRRLTAMQLQNMAGQQGYLQHNMYNILDVNGGEDMDDNTVVTVQTVVAATTTAGGSTIGSNYAAMNAATITAKATAAINQLSANQQQIIQQMAAMKVNSLQQSIAANTYNIPPILMINIPNHHAFNEGSFQWGWGSARGGGYQCGGGRGRRDGHGGGGRNPFANHAGRRNGQQISQLGGHPGFPGAAIPPVMQPHQQPRTANFSNIYKRYNNWNVCYSCGFDVEDGHTSMTCPFWKAFHQMGFRKENAQQYIAAGHAPCIKGMHKSVLPTKRYT
jgi:hypothetical protein